MKQEPAANLQAQTPNTLQSLKKFEQVSVSCAGNYGFRSCQSFAHFNTASARENISGSFNLAERLEGWIHQGLLTHKSQTIHYRISSHHLPIMLRSWASPSYSHKPCPTGSCRKYILGFWRSGTYLLIHFNLTQTSCNYCVGVSTRGYKRRFG